MKKLLVLSVIFLSLVSCESETDKKLRENKMEIAYIEEKLENMKYLSEEQLKEIYPEDYTEEKQKENAEWIEDFNKKMKLEWEMSKKK